MSVSTGVKDSLDRRGELDNGERASVGELGMGGDEFRWSGDDERGGDDEGPRPAKGALSWWLFRTVSRAPSITLRV